MFKPGSTDKESEIDELPLFFMVYLIIPSGFVKLLRENEKI